MQQIMSRKFLDTLEEVLTSARTSPVVRERLMDVLAAVAYASQKSKSSLNFSLALSAITLELTTRCSP
jgi:hypothetical protein